MIVIEKNECEKIPYEVSKTKICFDDDLTINLAKREADDPVHIDVCADEDGNLVVGAAAGREYVAEIDIPARAYEEVEVENGGDNDGEMSEKTTERKPLPLDMDKVTLTLWTV